ncbi:hypothetical protein ABIF68_002521 [Bradyrhizobium japonicum]
MLLIVDQREQAFTCLPSAGLAYAGLFTDR